MPKLDDCSWHDSADNFPTDLPQENGATHIGMFVAWAIRQGFWTDDPYCAEGVEKVRQRKMTGRDFLMEFSDGKFVSDDLTAEGRRFAESYYKKDYFNDYFGTVGDGLPTGYEVEDSWENYDRVAEVIGRRWAAIRK